MPARPFQAQTRVLSWKGNSTVKGNRRLGLSSHVFLESPSHPRADAFSRLPAPCSRPPSRSCHCSNAGGSRFLTQTPPEALELLLPPRILPLACRVSSCSLTAYHPRSRPTRCPPTTAAPHAPQPFDHCQNSDSCPSWVPSFTLVPRSGLHLHSHQNCLGGPVFRAPCFPLPGPWVQSLAGELRSSMLCGTA